MNKNIEMTLLVIKKHFLKLKNKLMLYIKGNKKETTIFGLSFLASLLVVIVLSLIVNNNHLKTQLDDYKEENRTQKLEIIDKEYLYTNLVETSESYQKKMKPYEDIDLEIAQTAQKQVDEEAKKVAVEEEAKKKEEAEKAAAEEAKKQEEAEKKAAEEAKKEEVEKKAAETAKKEEQANKHTASGEFTNVIQGLDSQAVESEIKVQSESDWPGDYEMQNYQYNNQIAAYNNLLNLSVDTEYKETILNNALNDWDGDYEMIKYQYGNQIEAYNWVQEQNLDTSLKQQIMNQAQSDWGTDYEMVKYEYENQLEASSQ